MNNYFEYDERLGIRLPLISGHWEQYEPETQESILLEWEKIRGIIPDRIKELEIVINKKQAMLENEDNFHESCCLNKEIADLASTINDLWIWYRTNGEVSVKHHH
ncbi:hypothetical protein [Bacillus marinisedimentorum]|uniref:hypothetical protein n=1 Tax=Bacillus marinisedimentorum TaxID=1821260 RepID=UPI0007E1173D|nr:hypothetical protein [Bacillus marinisedimentorum]